LQLGCEWATASAPGQPTRLVGCCRRAAAGCRDAGRRSCGCNSGAGRPRRVGRGGAMQGPAAALGKHVCVCTVQRVGPRASVPRSLLKTAVCLAGLQFTVGAGVGQAVTVGQRRGALRRNAGAMMAAAQCGRALAGPIFGGRRAIQSEAMKAAPGAHAPHPHAASWGCPDAPGQGTKLPRAGQIRSSLRSRRCVFVACLMRVEARARARAARSDVVSRGSVCLSRRRRRAALRLRVMRGARFASGGGVGGGSRAAALQWQ
jgi:hypothetical protein